MMMPNEQQRMLIVVANNSEKETLRELLQRHLCTILDDYDLILGTSGSVQIAREIIGNQLQYVEIGHGPEDGDARLMTLIHNEVAANRVVHALMLFSHKIEEHQKFKEALLWTLLQCGGQCIWLGTAATADKYFEMREAQAINFVELIGENK